MGNVTNKASKKKAPKKKAPKRAAKAKGTSREKLFEQARRPAESYKAWTERLSALASLMRDTPGFRVHAFRIAAPVKPPELESLPPASGDEADDALINSAPLPDTLDELIRIFNGAVLRWSVGTVPSQHTGAIHVLSVSEMAEGRRYGEQGPEWPFVESELDLVVADDGPWVIGINDDGYAECETQTLPVLNAAINLLGLQGWEGIVVEYDNDGGAASELGRTRKREAERLWTCLAEKKSPA